MALINVKNTTVSTSAGHEMTTRGKETPALPQRNGQRMKEKEFNEAVQNYLHVELVRCGIKHVDVDENSKDSLATRAKRVDASGAHLHIDIHANAFNGILDDKAGGIETFCWWDTPSRAVAHVIHKHVMKGTKMKDRGVKNGNHLYMISSVKPISILVELGFMDNKHDVEHLLSDAYRRECAVELAKGICEVFGKKYVSKPAPKPAPKPATKAKTFLRVVTGSFGSKDNAEARVKAIKAKGFDSFIDAETVNGKVTYRVVTGSFEDRENADARIKELKKAGFDSFLVAYTK